MIFVTVGTHEQPFNRLLQKIDELKKDGTIQDDVIIQTGFSTYRPQYCQWSKLLPWAIMFLLQRVWMSISREILQRVLQWSKKYVYKAGLFADL